MDLICVVCNEPFSKDYRTKTCSQDCYSVLDSKIKKSYPRLPHTIIDDALFTRLWNDGAKITEIMSIMGITKGVVVKARRRLKLIGRGGCVGRKQIIKSAFGALAKQNSPLNSLNSRNPNILVVLKTNSNFKRD